MYSPSRIGTVQERETVIPGKPDLEFVQLNGSFACRIICGPHDKNQNTANRTHCCINCTVEKFSPAFNNKS